MRITAVSAAATAYRDRANPHRIEATEPPRVSYVPPTPVAAGSGLVGALVSRGLLVDVVC